jgi:hypothetical protein
MSASFSSVSQSRDVALILRRPLHIFVTQDDDSDCRAILLATEGKCRSGADFPHVLPGDEAMSSTGFWVHAIRLFDNCKPVIAAVYGVPADGLELRRLSVFASTTEVQKTSSSRRCCPDQTPRHAPYTH